MRRRSTYGSQLAIPARKSSIGVLSPRLFSERSPSARTSKGVFASIPGSATLSPQFNRSAAWAGCFSSNCWIPFQRCAIAGSSEHARWRFHAARVESTLTVNPIISSRTSARWGAQSPRRRHHANANDSGRRDCARGRRLRSSRSGSPRMTASTSSVTSACLCPRRISTGRRTSSRARSTPWTRST
jgi:hypothetical protein